MAEVINVGEKGQIVIPKKFRDDLKIGKGTKLIIVEEKNRLVIKKVSLDEDNLWMLVGEETLKDTWDNPYDERWDDVL
jgi:AbrB family looped-hinge helix DNA binding protein